MLRGLVMAVGLVVMSANAAWSAELPACPVGMEYSDETETCVKKPGQSS